MKRYAVTLKAYGMLRRVVVEAENVRQAKHEAERGTSIGIVVKVQEIR